MGEGHSGSCTQEYRHPHYRKAWWLPPIAVRCSTVCLAGHSKTRISPLKQGPGATQRESKIHWHVLFIVNKDRIPKGENEFWWCFVAGDRSKVEKFCSQWHMQFPGWSPSYLCKPGLLPSISPCPREHHSKWQMKDTNTSQNKLGKKGNILRFYYFQ